MMAHVDKAKPASAGRRFAIVRNSVCLVYAGIVDGRLKRWVSGR